MHLFINFRYNRLRPAGTHIEREEVVHEIRKTRGGALLDVNDNIKSVLDDNDFVSVGKSCVAERRSNFYGVVLGG